MSLASSVRQYSPYEHEEPLERVLRVVLQSFIFLSETQFHSTVWLETYNSDVHTTRKEDPRAIKFAKLAKKVAIFLACIKITWNRYFIFTGLEPVKSNQISEKACWYSQFSLIAGSVSSESAFFTGGSRLRLNKSEDFSGSFWENYRIIIIEWNYVANVFKT